MKKVYVFLIMIMVNNNYLTAQPGTIDSTFGNNGLIYLQHNYSPNSSLLTSVDTLKRIVVSSYAPVDSSLTFWRFLNDGSVDSSFGNNGSVMIYLSTVIEMNTLVSEPDNKILLSAGGWNTSFSFILRLTETGNLDSAFGTLGMIVSDTGYFTGLAVQPDWKILATGTTGTGLNSDIKVCRFLTDGTPDFAFGDSGKVFTDPTTDNNDADGGKLITIQTDGKILVAGYNNLPIWGGSYRFAYIRYDSTGVLDSSFGSGGISIIYQGIASTSDMIVKDNQSILVAGNGDDGFAFYFYLRQLTPFGLPDSSFATNSFYLGGYATVLFRKVNSLTIQDDQKIIASGSWEDSLNNVSGMIAKFTEQGNPDTTFGNNGMALLELPGYSTYIIKSYMNADGKIVAIGSCTNQVDSQRVFMVRYNNDVINAINNSITAYSGLIFYPNPANDFIKVEANLSSQKSFISIYNISGQKISEQQINNNNKTQLDISTLPNGVYVVQLQNEKTVGLGKLIKH